MVISRSAHLAVASGLGSRVQRGDHLATNLYLQTGICLQVHCHQIYLFQASATRPASLEGGFLHLGQEAALGSGQRFVASVGSVAGPELGLLFLIERPEEE